MEEKYENTRGLKIIQTILKTCFMKNVFCVLLISSTLVWGFMFVGKNESRFTVAFHEKKIQSFRNFHGENWFTVHGYVAKSNKK